jgi:AcrR family transcriptional regulator
MSAQSRTSRTTRKKKTTRSRAVSKRTKPPDTTKRAVGESARTTERDEAVRRRIVRAAAELYREHGYEHAGMNDIARRLGMTGPALYWYFGSKEEILVAFLEHTIADLIQFVRTFIRSTEPRQRLWEFVYAYALWQLQQQELSAAYERIYALGHLRNSLPEGQRQRVAALEREFYGMCRDLVTEVRGKQRGSAAASAFALIGMVEHLITWFRPDGPMSVKDVASLYADYAVSIATIPAERAKAARKAA